MAFSYLLHFVTTVLPGRQSLSVYICSGLDPTDHSKYPQKKHGVIELLSVFIHALIFIRIKVSKFNEKSKVYQIKVSERVKKPQQRIKSACHASEMKRELQNLPNPGSISRCSKSASHISTMKRHDEIQRLKSQHQNPFVTIPTVSLQNSPDRNPSLQCNSSLHDYYTLAHPEYKQNLPNADPELNLQLRNSSSNTLKSNVQHLNFIQELQELKSQNLNLKINFTTLETSVPNSTNEKLSSNNLETNTKDSSIEISTQLQIGSNKILLKSEHKNTAMVIPTITIQHQNCDEKVSELMIQNLRSANKISVIETSSIDDSASFISTANPFEISPGKATKNDQIKTRNKETVPLNNITVEQLDSSDEYPGPNSSTTDHQNCYLTPIYIRRNDINIFPKNNIPCQTQELNNQQPNPSFVIPDDIGLAHIKIVENNVSKMNCSIQNYSKDIVAKSSSQIMPELKTPSRNFAARKSRIWNNKMLILSDLEVQSLATLATNIFTLISIGTGAMYIIIINSIDPKLMSQYPNYLYLYFLTLTGPTLMALGITISYYASRHTMRRTIFLELKNTIYFVGDTSKARPIMQKY